MKQTYLFSSVLFALGASLTGVGCQDSFKDCKNTATCPPEGDGDGDSSTGGVGGDGDGDGDGDTGGGGGTGGLGTGGGDGDGDGDGTGGMGGDPTQPCMGACDDDEHCNTADECVECFLAEHCDEETQVCHVPSGECVECVIASDCEDPALPMCEANVCTAGCETDNDCALFGEFDVCDPESGECVECLTRADCGGDVCERSTYTCVDDRPAGDVGVCEECEYDDDCATGQLCVEQSFPAAGGEVVGNFCTWRRDGRTVTAEGSCIDNGKPYAQHEAAVTSIEGQTADMCMLRTTTCPAFLQHSQTVDNCDDETPTSNSACGAPDLADGLCKLPDGGGNARCTYPCSSAEDCKLNVACTVDGYCAI